MFTFKLLRRAAGEPNGSAAERLRNRAAGQLPGLRHAQRSGWAAAWPAAGATERLGNRLACGWGNLIEINHNLLPTEPFSLK